jgi:phosphatidate cytidylyltransferase
LKTRIISGFWIVLIGVLVIIFSDTYLLNITAGLLIVLALREVFGVCKINNAEIKFFGYTLGIIPLLLDMIFEICFEDTDDWFSENFFGNADTLSEIIQILLVFSIFLSYLICRKTVKFTQVFITLASAILIRFSFSKFIEIGRMFDSAKFSDVKDIRTLLLILVICAAAFSDTGAYFIGTLLGKHKLCPEISPKKTIEGFIGGLVTNALLFPAVVFIYESLCSSDLGINTNMLIQFSVLGVVCGLIGVLGDLSTSAIKRELGVKDFGNLIPGHGGIIDRFDSSLFILPIFAFYAENFLKFKTLG